jgi:hypothetical protein
VLAMLSHSAVRTLNVEARCAPLGSAGVDGMTGSFEFYAFPGDLASNAPTG